MVVGATVGIVTLRSAVSAPVTGLVGCSVIVVAEVSNVGTGTTVGIGANSIVSVAAEFVVTAAIELSTTDIDGS